MGCTVIEMVTGSPPWVDEFPEPAAAMFNIADSNQIPKIPSSLSVLAQDFLRLCLKRDPKERSDVNSLLAHLWVASLVNLNINKGAPAPSPNSSFITGLGNNNNGNVHHPNAIGGTALTRSDTIPPIEKLPADLLLLILSFVVETDPKSVSNLPVVSKHWRNLMKDESFWKFRVNKSWPRFTRTPETKTSTWQDIFVRHKQHDHQWFELSIPSKPMKGKFHSKYATALIYNEKNVVSAGDDAKIKIWDLKKLKYDKSLKSHSGIVSGLTGFSADNSNLFWSCSYDKTVKQWDLKSRKVLSSFEAHSDSVTCIQMRPSNSSKMATGSFDKTCKIWDLNAERADAVLDGHDGAVMSLSYWDHLLLTGGVDRTIRLFDTRIKKCVKTLQSHTDTVSCIQFDNKDVVVSSSLDRTIMEWDLGSSRVINTYRGHSGGVLYCSFDSNKILSASKDHSIIIWSRHHPNSLTHTLNSPDAVTCLSFDRSKIISAGFDTVRVWSIPEK